MSKRILVVDDEEDLCEILQFNLETEGFEVDVAYSAEEALIKDLAQYHLILLDVMMGDVSGFKMANLMRKNPKTSTVPIIFLTARDSENDLITGFNVGADDYISKPFSIREVMVRIRAVLRRYESKTPKEESSMAFETLKMYVDSKKVFLDNEEISFTKKEFEILLLLLQNRNRVFSREEIISRVWNNDVVVLGRTVDVNITRLRRKIGIYGQNIVTRLGYGYVFEE